MCMFLPNKLKFKYKRYHRAHLIKRVTKFINFPHIKSGSIALKTLHFGFLLPNQLTALHQTLTKVLKKKSSIIYFVFPNQSLTAKPTGARMGKGKGKILSAWIFRVVAGFTLCEIHTKYLKLAINILKIAQKKLPLRTKIVLNNKKVY